MTRLVLLASLVFCVSCKYDFDPESDRFTCESDDDCIDGFVCAGQTLISGNLRSFCVKEENATLGYYMNIQSPFSVDPNPANVCRVFGTGATLPLEYRVWMETRSDSDGALVHDAINTSTTAFRPEPPATNPIECLADVGVRGDAKILCTVPYNSAQKSAAMWVEYRHSTNNTRYALMFGHAAIPTSRPYVINQDIRVYDLDLDQNSMSTTNRCLRMRMREQDCTNTLNLDCNCETNTTLPLDPCPPGFFCYEASAIPGTDQCWARGYGEAGVACDTLRENLCIDGCDTNSCL